MIGGGICESEVGYGSYPPYCVSFASLSTLQTPVLNTISAQGQARIQFVLRSFFQPYRSVLRGFNPSMPSDYSSNAHLFPSSSMPAGYYYYRDPILDYTEDVLEDANRNIQKRKRNKRKIDKFMKVCNNRYVVRCKEPAKRPMPDRQTDDRRIYSLRYLAPEQTKQTFSRKTVVQGKIIIVPCNAMRGRILVYTQCNMQHATCNAPTQNLKKRKENHS